MYRAIKKSRRVLIVASTLHIGGAEYMIANLCRSVDKKRFNIEACYLKEGGIIAKELVRNGVKVSVLAPKKGAIQRDYFSFLRLLSFINKHCIGIVHSHDIHSFIDCCFTKMFRPKLKHVHTFHFGNYPQRERKYLFIERLLWRIPDKLVAVGMNQGRSIERTIGVPHRRLEVAWNGVEEVSKTELHPKIAKLAGSGRLIIGSISTLIEQKGLFVLLEAVSKLQQKRNDFSLVIAGEGPLKGVLEEKIKSLRIEDAVFMLGWIPKASVIAMPGFDIFVQTSLWEAMSMVVIEAMAAAKPVVATIVGENTNVIDNEKSGILVEPGNPEAAAQAIEKLLDSPEKRKKIGEAARHRYEKDFTARAMALRYEQLYEEVLKEN